jgi:choline-sulfatase
MPPNNLLIICSDEHSRLGLGCYGSSVAKTPNLDQLAATGTRFANAYTPSPMCVPTRASLATGRYVHQTGNWSSAEPYDGSVPGWGHQLITKGHRVVSVGKLHYRSTEDDNGFDTEILPMHVANGVGWLLGLQRDDPLPDYKASAELAWDVGEGESDYTRYDRSVLAASQNWLREEGGRTSEKPWVLFTSFVAPHYPLMAPKPFFDLYADMDFSDQVFNAGHTDYSHPVLSSLRAFYDYDDHFDADQRRAAQQAYFGLCSFLDHNIGALLDTLDECGLRQNTQILYISDHGELLGEHGFWTKMVMYENSVGIPMILNGPGVPEGKTVNTPVSLIDIHPTALTAVGDEISHPDPELFGQSLFEIANAEDCDRVILSEYHDGGSITGFFMIRVGKWKYIHYVGFPGQLFDLDNDPDETNDLGQNEDYSDVLEMCEKRLREFVNPEDVNALAYADQRKLFTELAATDAFEISEKFGFTPAPQGPD